MGPVRAALIVACVLANGRAVRAQSPRFEVVSIKSCKDDPGRGNPGRDPFKSSPGRMRFDCVPLTSLIRSAYLMFPDGKPWRRSPRTGLPMYPVPYWQMQQPINGKAKWITSDRFTIDAKAEGPATAEMMRGPMLRGVLEDRFKLKTHWETREVPVYELTVAKGGLKLPAAKDGACIPQTPDMVPPAPLGRGQAPTLFCGGFHVPLSGKGSGLYAESLTMADLCSRFALTLERDVIDKTGLPGMYDVHLELTFADILPRPPAPVESGEPGTAPVAADPVGALTGALRKVGLNLQPAKGRGEFLVIDQAQRPTEN